MRRTWTFKVWATAVATLLVLGACGDGADDGEVEPEETAPTAAEADAESSVDPEPSEELLVVATTTILGDLVKGIVGDDATVTVLLPVGADPHDYQASSRDGVTIREADLVVANGLGLEEGLIAVLEAAHDDGARILEVGDMVDPMEWGEGRDPHEGEDDDHDHDEDEGEHDHDDDHAEDHTEDEGEHDDHDHDEDEGEHDHDDDHAEDHTEDEGEHDDHDHGHDHAHAGAFDPHFWFDPSRVQRAVELIAAELADIGKVLSASEWIQRGHDFAEEIGRAGAEAQEILAAVPESQRKLVTNHDSFSYFGVYFDFEVLDSVLPGSGLAQADTARLARVVEEIREEGVTTLFTETIADASVIMTVANEFDPPLAVVELYTGSLGPEGSDADTYAKWLVENARRIAEALAP
ncbi:MAG: zinc ABC transporter substrate-binding protein [Acidimicrobiia bacterium]|nr:zinc ABC transporter substrate-binding protein [Acidimicrobiia bacterium]